MPFFDFRQGFIRFKIVYYGPGLSGKTTNLEQLHLRAGGQTELVSIETEGDRTIFLDYLPMKLGKIGGIETVFKLHTVPGQVRYNRTRQMVLKDVDGVVFVADSQLAAMDDNLESLSNLERNLADDGVKIDDIPVVLQYNKRDLDEVASVGWLQNALNPEGRRWFEAVAAEGRNVRETLTAIATEVFELAATRQKLAGQGLARGSTELAETDPANEDEEFALAPVRSSSKARDTFRGAVSGTPSTPPAPYLNQQANGPVRHDTMTRLAGKPIQRKRTTKDLPVAAPNKPAMLSGLSTDQRFLVQIAELREMLEKLLADRIDREAIEEILAPLIDSTERLTDGIERNRLSIDDLSDRLDRFERHVGSRPAAVRPSTAPGTGVDVDDYLKDYIDDFESGSRS